MNLLSFRRSNITLFALVVITVIAAVLRFIQLDYAPSGGHGDVSWIGINALDWVDRGIVPFYVRELYSPEFIPVYFTGILLQVVGISFLPQRIFTAAMGVLFVALLYPMTYWLVGNDQSESDRQRAGLFAALTGALSLHIIGLNRLGMESPPFLTTVALFTWLVAWAWQRDGEAGSLRRWALAGAALALNQYVYLPARLLPIVLALWMLYLFLAQRSRFRKSLRGWVMMAAVSFVLTLPAIALFLSTPEAFSGRADYGTATTGGWFWLYDTSSYGGLFGLILRKIILTLQGIGLFWIGSYSLMGLPILSPVFVLGFISALILFIWRSRQIAFVWCALAIPVMLITDLISGAVPVVHALHQMGTLPFVCVLSGLGLAWLWQVAGIKLPRLAGLAVRFALVVGGAAPTVLGMSYYLQTVIPSEYADPEWSWRKAQTDVDLGRYVSSHAEQSFLLPYSEYVRPDVAWTVAAGYRERRSAVDGSGMLHIENPPQQLTVIHMEQPERPRHDGNPAHADPHLWVLLHDGTVHLLPPLTDAQVSAVMSGGVSEPLVDASETVVAQLTTIPTPGDLFAPRPVIGHPLDALFDGRVALLGYSTSAADGDLQPGSLMRVTLFWQALQPPAEDYEVYAQLWTDDGQAIANAHDVVFSGMYRSRIWQTDEIIATHHFLRVPEDVAAGRYTLVTGLYRHLLNENVQVEGQNADPALDTVRAGVFRVPRPETEGETVGTAPVEPLRFGDQLEIVGLNIMQDGVSSGQDELSARAGSSLDIQLTWEALDSMPTDYLLFVHITNEANPTPLVQVDVIIGGNYPTSIWRPTERLTSSVMLQIPQDFQPGTYRLMIGVYDWRSGARLSGTNGDTSYPLVSHFEVTE